uniref:Uncharacterized protein n=1 Tax=Cannabis sativa TaxID=3483 RepID=A0A803NLK4_CANSA
MLDSTGAAFVDELERSDSFIPTSISEEETTATRARQGSLSTNKIDRMVQELAELAMVKIRDRESTVSGQDYLVHSRHAPDIEVEKMGEDFEMEYVQGEPTMEVFSYFYHIKSVGHDNGFYCFSKWANFEINGVEGIISNMGD